MKRLQSLGINGIFLRNILGMYKKTEYAIKLKHGYTHPIKSNLGLKQGCPLSPMLFNLYIDDIDHIFDDSCDPITIHDEKLNHFLYADDLVILSQSSAGLQISIDKAFEFAERKHLTISVSKSKTIIFNSVGRFIKEYFNLNGKALEPVQSFCYLGFDIKCSGILSHAMNTLNDKGNKAMRPLLTAIRRFNIPLKTSIKLFHTYVSPILLYTTENWSTFSDLALRKFDNASIFSAIEKSKVDISHRKFLKNILGVTRSCPMLAVYGETGEIPLSLKSYRLTLNYWRRVTNLPDNTLAKKALHENVNLRSNWIVSIEKLINVLNLADKIDDYLKFKHATKRALEEGFIRYWKDSLSDPNLSRLSFYKRLKTEFKSEGYLDDLNFENRRKITKLICSDHALEIEKGRHNGINDRSKRICRMCHNSVEDEMHFLFHCSEYDHIRTKHNLGQDVQSLLPTNQCNNTAKYIIEALAYRDQVLRPVEDGVGGVGVN